MSKQQQVIDSKQQKNNSRIEICKDLYGKHLLSEVRQIRTSKAAPGIPQKGSHPIAQYLQV